MIPLLLGWCLAASVASFAAFAIDKNRARRGSRRIPERWLHAFSLVGGWPGSIAGIFLIRHKNRKAAFVLSTLLAAAAHAAAWVLILR
ncbi:MAG: DUF1294 domain-containing protein [Phycisphaerales bacterium]